MIAQKERRVNELKEGESLSLLNPLRARRVAEMIAAFNPRCGLMEQNLQLKKHPSLNSNHVGHPSSLVIPIQANPSPAYAPPHIPPLPPLIHYPIDPLNPSPCHLPPRQTSLPFPPHLLLPAQTTRPQTCRLWINRSSSCCRIYLYLQRRSLRMRR